MICKAKKGLHAYARGKLLKPKACNTLVGSHLWGPVGGNYRHMSVPSDRICSWVAMGWKRGAICVIIILNPFAASGLSYSLSCC
jgi:hypothetical protein